MNPFDEVGDLSAAEAAIAREEFRKRCSPGGSTYEELKALGEADYDEGSQRKARDLGWTDDPPAEGSFEILIPKGEGAPTGKALFLTQQQWDDLCEIVQHSVKTNEWMGRFSDEELSDFGRKMRRRSALAERIIEANQ